MFWRNVVFFLPRVERYQVNSFRTVKMEVLCSFKMSWFVNSTTQCITFPEDHIRKPRIVSFLKPSYVVYNLWISVSILYAVGGDHSSKSGPCCVYIEIMVDRPYAMTNKTSTKIHCLWNNKFWTNRHNTCIYIYMRKYKCLEYVTALCCLCVLQLHNSLFEYQDVLRCFAV
jgi:hypothetical protein